MKNYKYLQTLKSNNVVTTLSLLDEATPVGYRDVNRTQTYYIKMEEQTPPAGDPYYNTPTKIYEEDEIVFKLDTPLTADEQSAIGLVKEEDDGTFSHIKTNADHLEYEKNLKIQAIDNKTDELINAGFNYESKLFWLDDSSKNIWNSVYAKAVAIKSSVIDTGNAKQVLPFVDNGSELIFNAIAKDGLSMATLNVDNYMDFYDEAVSAEAIIRYAGNSLREDVNSCLTVSEVATVQDNR